MRVARKKPGRVKQSSKWLGAWSWRLFAAASTLIGISGIPGDLDTWAKWIDILVNDPLLQQLAAQAVAIADFVNQPWVRTALVIGGLLMLFWPVRWFWRFRHRLVFWGKRALDQKVWISRDKAFELLRESRWAISRQRRAQKPRNRFEWAVMVIAPDRDEQNAMFHGWCILALDQFAEHNPTGVRKSGEGQEFDESLLKTWLDQRYKSDLTAEFGQPY